MKEGLRRIVRGVAGVVVLAAVAAAAGGAGLLLGLNLHISDPTVQAGLVGAVAGIAGGLLGASIGAWSAWRIADRTLDDAQAARVAAREEARADRFLDARRTAIADVLLQGEWSVDVALDRGRKGPESLKKPIPKSEREGFDRTFSVMTLLAPDLAIGEGGEYSRAVHDAVGAAIAWAAQPDLPEGASDRRPLPTVVREALEALGVARSRFIASAVFHLGVLQYSHDRVLSAVEKQEAAAALHAAEAAASPTDQADDDSADHD